MNNVRGHPRIRTTTPRSIPIGRGVALACALALAVSVSPTPVRAEVAGQLLVDPDAPAWWMRTDGSPVFLCGPGDPEGFL